MSRRNAEETKAMKGQGQMLEYVLLLVFIVIVILALIFFLTWWQISQLAVLPLTVIRPA